MNGRRQGGIGPTGSLLKVNKGGSVGFTTPDPADGARPTTAPSYYQRHERWKQNLSEEDLKALLWCVLLQYHNDKRVYEIEAELVKKIKCPPKLTNSDLRWLQKQNTYDFIAKQVHSHHLSKQIKK